MTLKAYFEAGDAMERRIAQQLEVWKNRKSRKPLILYGARQTGKTWILKEFGARSFRNVAYIDFVSNESARRIFDADFDIDRIVRSLSLNVNTPIEAGKTLIMLDEVQECPRALTALKYFYEDAPDQFVVAAGSYLGIALRDGASFPVGKVETLTLHPCDFLEFLRAVDQQLLAEAIEKKEFDLIGEVFSERLTRLLKEYLYVGGMPEAIVAYAESGDAAEARRVQRNILQDYDLDFSKHVPLRLLERLRLVWNSLPTQLAKENRKFVFGLVREGARAREFEECIQWLCDYGATMRVPRVSALRTPLSGYEDLNAFKLFCLDVGLLGAMADLSLEAVTEGSRLFTEFKGALVEQYVGQQLCGYDVRPFYWSAESGTAEVDFAIQQEGKPLPIEVKAAENLRAKSLRVAVEKFDLERAVRTSLSAYRDEGWLLNVPLWAIGTLVAPA